ncbi:MAG TPA: EscU/YscU/HrcU family type III secretion system export apparatus switch protein, partial [Limnochordia bacterium]
MTPGEPWIDLQLFAESRTEPATPRRRLEARRRGQVVRTGELAAALELLAVFGLLYVLARIAASES